MKTGKASEAVLDRSVFRQLKTKRPEVLQGAGIGLDYAAVELAPGEVAVYAAEPVAEAGLRQGSRTVIAALNNVACAGARPVGILVNLFIPTVYNEEQLRELVKELESACGEAGAQIMGGHTEITPKIKEPLLTITGVGKVQKDKRIDNRNLKPGMDILLTKWIGLEGSWILAQEREEELRGRYPAAFLEKAKAFDKYFPQWQEAEAAAEFGVDAMHDVSKGGVFAALWELAECAGVGLEIDMKKIPIRQETVEICEFFEINPYQLLSGGCMLMAAWDGNGLVRVLEKEGIPAAVIGKATGGKDRVLLQGEEKRFLVHAQTDEIYRVRKV